MDQSPSAPRPPSGHSMLTINTLDIDGLAARNEERARRLEAILNTRRESDNQHSSNKTILDKFMSGLQRGGVNGRVTHDLESNSEKSLDCQTTFYPTHKQS